MTLGTRFVSMRWDTSHLFLLEMKIWSKAFFPYSCFKMQPGSYFRRLNVFGYKLYVNGVVCLTCLFSFDIMIHLSTSFPQGLH